MQEREAFQLLTLASARDGRKVTPEVAKVWAVDLEGIGYHEAVQAATEHYRQSDRWLMPSHVIERVTAARRALEPPRSMSPEVPQDCGKHRWMPDGTCLFCASRLAAIES